VRRQLRREVGFGCPIPGCGSPYLRWHHFDPPWGVREHHNPAGMIALCGEHHSKADAGAFTRDQLCKFKQLGREQGAAVKGRFDWMRHNLLGVLGGTFRYGTTYVVKVGGRRIIWFERDEEGYVLLNMNLPESGGARLLMRNNYWMSFGHPIDLDCPPSGKRLHVWYENGDWVKVEFHELQSPDDLAGQYTFAPHEGFSAPFPVTAVNVDVKIAQIGVWVDPEWIHHDSTSVGGIVFSTPSGVAVPIEIDIPPHPRWTAKPN
jgi:hypothetical protein